CVGCGSCIDACPYGARYFNPLVKAGGDSSENAIGKCTFCQHRVEKGVLPACVNTCPGKARIFGDLNDPTSEVSKLVKKFKLSKNSVLLPEENTLPQVYYIDTKGVLTIYKFNKATKQAEFMDQIA
ncbi:MAG: 4Fe-4S dicluster domain-containing protein, partial [SAR324 cluster bacterium]|nr:4Fe-4S dicluster domain-containing protein [SAR324 cluster bacterium]